MRRVVMEEYLANPEQFELRSGNEKDAPDCPYGNRYQWVGYDKKTAEYVRFSKSVFKKLIKNEESATENNQ